MRCSARHVLNSLIILAVIDGSAADAQITLDGSMGIAGALTGPNFTIPSTVGQTRGSNLFHSFGLLNVLTNQRATFTGPNSISNIFGRVTGGQQSIIDGTIRSTIPNANLFLMNPAGILFGFNASLDVRGSFHATTADYLKFSDGAKFHADLNRQSTLTSAPVSAFGFLSQNPAGITIDGSILTVPQGKTFSLVGGDIEIFGDPFTTSVLKLPTVGARSGKIQMASVASPGEVPADIANVRLTDFQRLGTIYLNNALIDASGNANGSIVIRGGRFLVDQSLVFADNFGDLNNPGAGIDVEVKDDVVVTNDSVISTDFFGAGNAGKIHLTANALELSNSSGILSRGFSPSTGDGGNVEIRTSDMNITDGGTIATATSGPGTSGAIDLRAENSFIMSGGATILSTTTGSGVAGRSGNITISAKDISMTNDAQLGTSTVGTGRAGSVAVEVERLSLTGGARIINSTASSGQGGALMITATESIVIAGASGFGSSGLLTPASGSGDAGSIAITTPSLTVDGGAISAQTRSGGGNAGSIDINVDRLILTTGGQIGSSTRGAGNGGQVTVNATQAVIMDGVNDEVRSGLFANTSGSGDGGSVTVRAPNVSLGSGASMSTLSTDSGRAGSIVVESRGLTLTGRSAIVSSTVKGGDGGTVNVSATAAVSLSNSAILTDSFGTKAGGDIQIQANQIYLGDNAVISASSSGSGNAGNINLIAQTFRSSYSSVATQADIADGGNIHLTVGKLVDLFNSQITATVNSGTGSGGNITIDPTFVVLNHSQITANAFGGPGGNIIIVADNFLASPDSSVTASSALSTPGTVDIQAPIIDLSGSLTPLPEAIAQASSLLRQSCATRFSSGKASSLAAMGRDSTPYEPGRFLASSLFTSASISTSQDTSEAILIASAQPRFSIASPCVTLH